MDTIELIKRGGFEEMLICPICRSGMHVERRENCVLECKGERRHSYDISASGYVNLSPPEQSGGGDSKGAVRARSSFLECGYYAPVAERICRIVKEHIPSGARLVDAGCGEGYYSVALAKEGYSVLGADLSKFAASAASKRAGHSDATAMFCVSSVFSLPVCDGGADGVVNIFAPCVPEEYARVLKEDGYLLVVYAGADHLRGLKEHLYERVISNEERADLPKNMTLVAKEELKYSACIEGEGNIAALFSMTPYYWRTAREDAQKLEGLTTLNTEIHMIFSLYKPQKADRR